MGEPAGFREFVAARSPALLRTAWLLTGDWFLAQDLVQEAMSRTWPRWDKITRRDAPEVYVRRVMVTTYLSWRQRRWRAEVPAEVTPERAQDGDPFDLVDLHESLVGALRALPPRQRAVLVLRFFDDLTEPQVADVLECSVGTVKSQVYRSLARLRGDPSLAGLLAEEVVP